MGLMTILMNYGFLVFGVTDYVAPLRTLHYGAALPGHPKTQAEKGICTRLGMRLGEWVAYYVDGDESCHPKHASYSRHG
jgi:NAD(P)H dehydrogenase (quinone)